MKKKGNEKCNKENMWQGLLKNLMQFYDYKSEIGLYLGTSDFMTDHAIR